MLPYLPDLLKDVVEKVSLQFSELETGSFTVGFNHGNYPQFWRDADKEEMKLNPVVWLIMPFTEKFGHPIHAYEASGIEIAVFMKSEANYSQAQRDELIFKPILLPVYEALFTELSKRTEFGMPNMKDLNHKRVIRPYWGGGEPGGTSQPNIHKTYVDAVYILDLKLNVKKLC